MKLYVVTLPIVHEYAEIRDAAKSVDPYGIVTVVESGRKFEFQNKLGADEVSRRFDGLVETIEYNIKDLYK